ncbi:FliJ protein [Marinospirillum celere]|uniref:Flagellar FliJ protein n=1 Tax=Marinospirillum celere TaxID=1122252 RepID=A0A1I1H0C4_9GAMM|nr:flagellar export protein FliJ [Marinospirillum celere]SFC17507.1 FliJ protein [Marinospirillum celere]
MSRQKRLQPVLRLAEGKAEEASRALGYLNQKIEQEAQTKEQLKGYEKEYLQLMRCGDEPGRRMDIQAVLRYQAFVQRLEHAQIQQQEQIELLQRQKDQVTEHWIKTRARVKGLESIIESARREEEREAERKEQKLADEFTSTRYARNS